MPSCCFVLVNVRWPTGVHSGIHLLVFLGLRLHVDEVGAFFSAGGSSGEEEIDGEARDEAERGCRRIWPNWERR